MNNPFKNNSLASFLIGIIVGAGGCIGFYAITEPEASTSPQGQMLGIMGTNTGGQNITQTTSPEQNDVNTPSASNDNSDMIHTQWYEGKKYHGLTDNPEGNVRVTPAGKKYHRPSCPNIKGHDFISATQSDAENAGLTPCKKCKP